MQIRSSVANFLILLLSCNVAFADLICNHQNSSTQSFEAISCEGEKSKCAEFYNQLTPEAQKKLSLDCNASSTIPTLVSCSSLITLAAIKGYSHLSEGGKDVVKKVTPNILKTLAPRILPFVAGLATVGAAYSVIDLTMEGLERSEQCYNNNAEKRLSLELLNLTSDHVNNALQGKVNPRELELVRFPKDYLSDTFIQSVSCERIKEISLTQKKKLDALLGPLIAQNKIPNDPRKDSPLNSEDQNLISFFTKNASCIPIQKQIELFCTSGNLVFGLNKMKSFVKDYEKSVNRSALAQQRDLNYAITLSKYDPSKEISPLELGGNFDREERGLSTAFGSRKVKYLTPDEQQQHLVTIKGGKVYDSQGNLFDTSDSVDKKGITNKAIFVLDSKGNIYISKYQKPAEFQHSSLVAGKPVLMAGELEIVDGVIVGYSRKSGHYRPTEEHLEVFKKYMKSKGIDLNKANFDPETR